MITLITLVTFALIIFYLQSYFRINKETQIIQTSLTTFHPDLLLEKQPIYVNDNVYNPADVISSIFKYQYIQKVLSLSNTKYLKQNLSRYVLIYNDQEYSTDIYLINPSNIHNIQYYNGIFVNKHYKVCKNRNEIKDSDMIKVILKPYQIFVIPMGWIYRTSGDNLLEIHLFDCITRLHSFFA